MVVYTSDKNKWLIGCLQKDHSLYFLLSHVNKQLFKKKKKLLPLPLAINSSYPKKHKFNLNLIKRRDTSIFLTSMFCAS
ncbi:hypothetical protein Hanom_Chr03g00279301 [Helianthus anomalus]